MDYEPQRRRDPLLLVGLIGTILLHGGLFGFLWLRKANASTTPILGPGTFVDAQLVKFGKPRDLTFLPHKQGVMKSVAALPEIKVAREADALPIPPEQRKEQEKPDRVDPLKKTHGEIFKHLNDDQPEAVVEEGGSLTGSRAGTATEASGDPYIASLIDQIGSSWQIPTTIPDSQLSKLSAEVCLTITSTGVLTHYEIMHGSGNSQFDSSLEATLSTTKKLPPPPPRFAGAAARGRLCPTFNKQ